MAQPEHIRRLNENLREVQRLAEIHATVAGTGPGHKHDVEVLNKSAVVLLVACWEAFVEDLASAAFKELLTSATDPTLFPPRVLTLASKTLREDSDERKIWALAGDGWKQVLSLHSQKVVAKFVSPLNTPRAEQCNRLFEGLIGMNVSACWHWQGMSAEHAGRLLDELITLRGEIAHRVAASSPVRKHYVLSMRSFVARLAVASHNSVSQELRHRIGHVPWVTRGAARPGAAGR